MKVNLTYTLQGPAGTIEAPHKNNPLHGSSFKQILTEIVESLPNENNVFGVKVIAIKIESVE